MLDARTGKIVNYRNTLFIVYNKIERLHNKLCYLNIINKLLL